MTCIATLCATFSCPQLSCPTTKPGAVAFGPPLVTITQQGTVQ